MIVGMDLLMGRFSGLLGWGGLYVAWFTFWLLVTRGRSAGYSASAATLMLGFLEALWHPNRQAIHDKIAGTAVLRVR